MIHIDLLGKQVEDTVTGFCGIVTAVTDYLNGCTRVTVEPRIKDDGSLPEPQYFDVQQVLVVGSGVASRDGGAAIGGPPRRDAPRW